MSYRQRVALLDKPDTLGAATAGSNYQRNSWAARQGEALSGSPGNCCYPGEEARSPGGPAQPHACQPSPETGLGLSLPWQHPATNPQKHCPSQLLCYIYPLGNNSALHITPEQQPSPHIIQLPEVQVSNTPIPYSMSASSICLPAPSTAPKAPSTRPLPRTASCSCAPCPTAFAPTVQCRDPLPCNALGP